MIPKRVVLFAGVVFLLLFLMSCDNFIHTVFPTSSPAQTTENPLAKEEVFTQEDAPEVVRVGTIDVTTPWGYTKTQNANRLYPLVVSGYRGEGKARYKSVEKLYPSFVIDYQKDSTTDGEALANWIDSAISAGYRLDPNRIYLTGFSRGGSGSYPLARGMHNKGKYFAAIMRVAGQSQDDIGNTIASRTALWYHIGLEDDVKRVSIARSALDKFRNYACNSTAQKTEITDTVNTSVRTTITLWRNGRSMFKYSEYPTMGHSSTDCYKDGTVFSWMFSQTVQ